jgi:hypothetical protein
MPYPLTLDTMLQRNRPLSGKKEDVSRDFSGSHRYTYADSNVRVATRFLRDRFKEKRFA